MLHFPWFFCGFCGAPMLWSTPLLWVMNPIPPAAVLFSIQTFSFTVPAPHQAEHLSKDDEALIDSSVAYLLLFENIRPVLWLSPRESLLGCHPLL